jgi:hypothetical protein
VARVGTWWCSETRKVLLGRCISHDGERVYTSSGIMRHIRKKMQIIWTGQWDGGNNRIKFQGWSGISNGKDLDSRGSLLYAAISLECLHFGRDHDLYIVHDDRNPRFKMDLNFRTTYLFKRYYPTKRPQPPGRF